MEAKCLAFVPCSVLERDSFHARVSSEHNASARLVRIVTTYLSSTACALILNALLRLLSGLHRPY